MDPRFWLYVAQQLLDPYHLQSLKAGGSPTLPPAAPAPTKPKTNRLKQLFDSIPKDTQQGLWLGLLGAGIGTLFPNAFAEPGSGYKRTLMTQMLESLQRQDRTGRTMLRMLANLPPTTNTYYAAQQTAQAQAKRQGEAATRTLPAGVQMPGLQQRIETAAYAQLARPLQDLLRQDNRDAYERILQQINMLQAIGGQSRDLANSYGYLAQLYGQMGNNWTGMLPQLFANALASIMLQGRQGRG